MTRLLPYFLAQSVHFSQSFGTWLKKCDNAKLTAQTDLSKQGKLKIQQYFSRRRNINFTEV